MKRVIPGLFLAVLSLLGTGCGSDGLELKLRELDRVLDERPDYAAAFEKRADSLRREMTSTLPDSVRWELAHELYSLFHNYQVDTSARYVRIMDALAGDARDRRLETLFCQAETDISLRKYKESERLLAGLDTLLMSDEGKNRYYILMLQLYATELRDESLSRDSEDIREAKRDEIRNRLIASPGMPPLKRQRWQAIQAYKEGRYDESIRSLEELVRTETDLHDRALAAWSLSVAYSHTGYRDKRMFWLAQSAIYDLQVPVREYHSLYYLANLLYEGGQLVRASRYSQRALDDALSCNYNAWVFNSASMQLDIVKAVEHEEKQRHRVAVFVILLLSALSLLIAILLLRSRAQSKKIRSAAEAMERMNRKLEEANKIKEGYVFRYVNMSAKYLGLVEEYRHSMRVTLKESGEEALKQMLRQPSGTGDNYKQFYRIFDEAFLGIFPDFVERVNALLKEEARFSLGSKGEFPTGLRILAAIRLGITDSGKIAEFLNCAPTSVYTHRSKIKKNALCPPDEFEERLSQI